MTDILRKTALAAAAAIVLCAGTAQAQGLAGPYLAANQADLRDDYDAAADYYSAALRADPENRAFLQSALIANIVADRMQTALALAADLEAYEPDNQVMALTLMAEAIRAGNFARAREIAETDAYRLNPLFARLVTAWTHVGEGDYGAATEVFDSMTENSAFEVYGQYHKALALALAGDFATAAELLDGNEDGPLHLNRMALLAHVASLSQADRMEDAISLAKEALANNLADPELSGILAALEAGQPLQFDQIGGAADGAAAVYALLAGALAREEAERFGLVYGRLARHIRPDYDEVTVLLADILATQEQHDLAVDAYEEIATDSPWYVSAEIGRADSLRASDRVDEAIEVLSSLARAQPSNLSVQTALGDMLRNNEEFGRAADAYDGAIALIENENSSHWLLYYSRGITLERTDRWDEAERDFRKALELQPDQPLVLNYLGYSLVELRRNLEEAQQMIEKAVEQRPEDGYITDSLGWVLYRLGKYDEAVGPMERAVELLPVDPIINDHLGDVYWKVGREREAEFQWKRALSFEPEEEEAERIRRKLDVGLDVVLAEEEAAGEEPAATALGD